mgnify:CR=1 FL=1
MPKRSSRHLRLLGRARLLGPSGIKDGTDFEPEQPALVGERDFEIDRMCEEVK